MRSNKHIPHDALVVIMAMAVDVFPNPGQPQILNKRVDCDIIDLTTTSHSSLRPTKSESSCGTHESGGLWQVAGNEDTEILC